MTEYKAKPYWEKRLSENFNLQGTGNLYYSLAYNTLLYKRKQSCLQKCLAETDLKDKSVLDIGCGNGFFVDWYINHGAHVTGLDITETSINTLKRKFPKNTFIKADITQTIDLPQTSFDIVNAWDIMYHIVDEKAFQAALNNCSSYVANGGLFITTDLFASLEPANPAPHVQHRTIETYNRLLKPKGFTLKNNLSLYGLLNRRIICNWVDNKLGLLYFIFDNLLSQPSRNNLSVAVWSKTEAI